MKLLKALKWFFFEYEPGSKYYYPMLQVEKIAGVIVLFFVGLVYFFIEGLVSGNTKQMWGCGFGLLATSIPLGIMVVSLLGIYDENIGTND